jgi:hypothetical protein
MFPVRYKLKIYILFRRHSFFKKLMQTYRTAIITTAPKEEELICMQSAGSLNYCGVVPVTEGCWERYGASARDWPPELGTADRASNSILKHCLQHLKDWLKW